MHVRVRGCGACKGTGVALPDVIRQRTQGHMIWFVGSSIGSSIGTGSHDLVLHDLVLVRSTIRGYNQRMRS